MPYVFSDWEHCVDPAGNSVTLEWTEAGMRGRPAGLYLEALRQAAVLRVKIHKGAGGFLLDAPVLMTPVPETYAMGGRNEGMIHRVPSLPEMLRAIHTVAWDAATEFSYTYNRMWTSGYWVDPTTEDLSGSTVTGITGPGDRMVVEEDLLNAIGQEEVIPLPNMAWGQISSAYLRQLRDVLMVKRVYVEYQTLGYAGSRSKWVTKPTWEELAAAFPSVPWDLVVGGSNIQYYAARPDSSHSIAQRRKGTICWWDRSSPLLQGSCNNVDLYLYSARPAGVGNYYNEDYPSLVPDQWQKYRTGVMIPSRYEEELGAMETIGSPPPIGTYQGRGWRLEYALALCRFENEWALY